jgi:signal transduction histidine kinase
MVQIVASRIAAIRLVWIIAVLMIPIVFLGFFMVRNINADIDFNRKEIAGMEFLAALSQVMLDAAEGKAKSENYDILLKAGPRLAEIADQRGAFEPLLKAISLPNSQPTSILKLTYQLIQQTGEQTNIILDPFADTYYLGAASTQGMSDWVLRFKQLQYAADVALKNPTDANLALVVFADGALRESSRLMQSQVNSAKNAGRSSYDYLPILGDFDVISKVNAKRSEAILKGFGISLSETAAMLQGIVAKENTSFAVHRSLWKKINDRFVLLKEQQTLALTEKLSVVIIASLVSVLIGLGSAVAMFYSTLKRLDDISQSKLDAEKAQQEAECMTQKLGVINDDMVKVNQELASQMQKLHEAQAALVSKGRMEQLGQLTATIAHELRNPLGAVRTSAFLIERKIKGKNLGFETQLARINNGVSRCDDIITQLLDFSRTKPLAPRASDLDQWLVKVIEDEARQLASAISIECDLNLAGCLVPFDPARLQRAIINLVSNASEAMVGKGDDPSRFATSNPVLNISTELFEGHAVIKVKDNGPGITKENLARIREPLFTTKSFGTGLGLPAVDQIANQHQGRLEVRSQLGQGAEFALFLPLNLTLENAA